MMNDTTPDTIRCANLTGVARSDDGSFELDKWYLTLYVILLIVILSVTVGEWRRWIREAFKWILWLPFLSGIILCTYAICLAGLQPKNSDLYTQSQPTRDFIDMCSDPLTQRFNSPIATHAFFAECNTVQNRMNPDIGGIGIRISLYISLAVTILSSLAGHFHQEKTVVKDIGTAQFACEYLVPQDHSKLI